MAEREKGSEKFPKILFPPHGMDGEWKGFTKLEASPRNAQLRNDLCEINRDTEIEEDQNFVPHTDEKSFIFVGQSF